jgi:hypothetical protein
MITATRPAPAWRPRQEREPLASWVLCMTRAYAARHPETLDRLGRIEQAAPALRRQRPRRPGPVPALRRGPERHGPGGLRWLTSNSGSKPAAGYSGT